MKLYIKIENGIPVDHPIIYENLIAAYPNLDVNNLQGFAEFERTENTTTPTEFQISEASYALQEGIVKESWSVRDMTETEIETVVNNKISHAYAYIEAAKEFATTKINAAANDDTKAAWESYMTSLNNWVLIDPLNTQFPNFPLEGPDGNVRSTTTSGSAPNVIG